MPTGLRSNVAMRPLSVCFAFVIVLSALAFAPSAQATNGVEKEMTFLLHSVNNTETAKPLPGGGFTLTYFDTTLEFNDENVTLTASGTNINFDFYLTPALAGDFTTNAFSFKIWSKFVSGASNDAQITISLLDRLPDRTEATVHLANFGSVQFAATPELKVFDATFAAYTFQADHSVKFRFTVTPGFGKTFEFYYDTAQMNSQVSFTSPDSLDVAAIVTLDANRNPTTSFDPLAPDKTMYVQARVTDPLGGYDIRWVNLTLYAPDGSVLLDNVSMAQVSGTPISFESLFETAWDYTGQPNGPYTVLVWALDNNGHNHYYFFQQFTFADYPDVGTTVFYIGGLPFYAWILVQDSLGLPLEDALVSLSSGGNPMDSGKTDARGMVNLTAFGGTYDVHVTWADVLVAQASIVISGNITESDPFVVDAAVYYPAIRALDANGLPVSNAAVFLTYANGTVASVPIFTDALGVAELGRQPGGSLSARILWRGVEVATVVLTVDANAPPPIDISVAVYYLTVTVIDSRAVPLADAQVVLADAVYGLIADARITDGDGQTVSRLPIGTYAIDVAWNDVPVSSGTLVTVDANGAVAITAEVYYLTVAVVDSRSDPVAEADIVARAASGRIFTSDVTDADGLAILRVPATTVLLEAEWLGVPVGSRNVAVTGDAAITFAVAVYTLDLQVIDGNGAALPGAQVTVEADGRVYALEVTDAAGRVSIRLPGGTYTVRARFTAAYLYTYVDASGETVVDLSGDAAETIRLGAYPPPVTSTVAFGFGLLAAILAAGLSLFFYWLGKRRGPKSPRAPMEPPKGGERE